MAHDHMHMRVHARRIYTVGTWHMQGAYRDCAHESYAALFSLKNSFEVRGALDELSFGSVKVSRADLAAEVGGREELPLDQVGPHDLGHLSGWQVAQLLNMDHV
eukprot:scaffold13594_cov66-Phaeocystis_antarctica.AAC.2